MTVRTYRHGQQELAANPPLPKKMNFVLLVDDEEIDLFINRKLLTMHGVCSNIHSETSVKGALEFLRLSPVVPDLILLDLKMPNMDGLDFLNEFERLPNRITDKCKVVLLSAYIYYHEDEVKQAKAHPALYKYLQKPLNIHELLGINIKDVATD
jgi:CheY-like chemotaxis protein